MYKKILGLGLILMLVGIGAFAATTETITLTTYYPAPYGVYLSLATKRISIGGLTPADQPNRDGDARFQPQPGVPENWPAGQPGELAYSQDTGDFYHYDGVHGKWAAAGGGGGVMYFDGFVSDTIPITWNPPNCPAGWTECGTSESISAVTSPYAGGIAPKNAYKITRVCVKN